MMETASSVRRRPARCLFVCALTLLLAPAAFAQTDQMFFPAVDNVTDVLVSKINAETVRIDMSTWYLTEHAVAIALVNAFNRGVQVRLMGDRGSIFEIDPRTRGQFYWLASQGVPIRIRRNPWWFPEIDHWKTTIFKGQQLVMFGSANYTPFQLAPASTTNYSDETVMATSDPALVGAFLTKFDVMWNDTTAEPESRVAPPYYANWNDACWAEPACGDYWSLYPVRAAMTIDTRRLEPDNPTPPDLYWGQGAEFNARVLQEISNETSAIKVVAYRLTVPEITQALLAKFRAGVVVQLIIEPDEYSNRRWPEFWLTRANIDTLWAAGVPIEQRQHVGITHMKLLLTSSYATNASSNFTMNWQRDQDYFVAAAGKPAAYQAIANRFTAMWSDPVGFAPFVPLKPDPAVLTAPALEATGTSLLPTLSWNRAPFATSYDIYLGTSPGSLALVGNVPAQLVNDPPASYSWTATTPLAASTLYFWRVVSRTNATARDPSVVSWSDMSAFTTGAR